MTYQDHTDDRSTASTWSSVTADLGQAGEVVGQAGEVVNNEAAKQFAALNKLQKSTSAAVYNGNAVTADYRDLLTHVVDNFHHHCFAANASDIPICFLVESSQQVKATYILNGRNITGDLFAMDNVYFDLTKCSEGCRSIPMYTKAGSMGKLCSTIRCPNGSYTTRVSSLQHDKEQGLDAVTIHIDSKQPPIFTTITKQCDNHQVTYVLHKRGALTDFAKTTANRGVYRGTGFFTAKVTGACYLELELTLVGTRIFDKTNAILPVPWNGNSAGKLGI
jgi:hypothetical protein